MVIVSHRCSLEIAFSNRRLFQQLLRFNLINSVELLCCRFKGLLQLTHSIWQAMWRIEFLLSDIFSSNKEAHQCKREIEFRSLYIRLYLCAIGFFPAWWYDYVQGHKSGKGFFLAVQTVIRIWFQTLEFRHFMPQNTSITLLIHDACPWKINGPFPSQFRISLSWDNVAPSWSLKNYTRLHTQH